MVASPADTEPDAGQSASNNAGKRSPASPVVAQRGWLSRHARLGPLALVIFWITWAYIRSYPRAAIVDVGGYRYRAWAVRHLAYTDIVTLYQTRHLADHVAPYIHQMIQYLPLTGLFMWCAAWLPGERGFRFLCIAVCLIASVGTLVVLDSRRAREALASMVAPPDPRSPGAHAEL